MNKSILGGVTSKLQGKKKLLMEKYTSHTKTISYKRQNFKNRTLGGIILLSLIQSRGVRSDSPMWRGSAKFRK